MDLTLYLLLFGNFAVIGGLPLAVFRRDGRLGLNWWLTAAPFFVCVGLLTAVQAEILPGALPLGTPIVQIAATAAVPLSVLSILLIGYTAGSHQTRPALWHQENDTPKALVTSGAYARIRHPFYTAFLLALLAALFAAPQLSILAVFLWALVALNRTAAREESRILASALGDQYSAYVQRAGRFLPRLGGAAR